MNEIKAPQQYIQRTFRAKKRTPRSLDPAHRWRIMQELRNTGLSHYALHTMESHYLPNVIHRDEHIEAAAFGYLDVGLAMLIATNWRLIFLDRKPLFINEDEVNYRFISGVMYNHTPIGSTIILHTRIKDFKLLSFNRKGAQKFVNYIEERCLDHMQQRGGMQ